MPILVDTDVAIHLRDGEPETSRHLLELGEAPVISAVTLAELRGGAALDPLRDKLLADFLRFVPVLPFADGEAGAYGEIVRRLGHDRRRVLDRMIAAQAIVAGLRLVTMNGRDFRDVPGLALEEWPSPTPPPS